MRPACKQGKLGKQSGGADQAARVVAPSGRLLVTTRSIRDTIVSD
jgi:hypothetical protein